jgi:hypothetical protein
MNASASARGHTPLQIQSHEEKSDKGKDDAGKNTSIMEVMKDASSKIFCKTHVFLFIVASYYRHISYS